jgi:hypothetical protein
MKHADFMTDPAEFLQVQNGKATAKSLTPGAALYLHDGRGLAAYTHVDVLYQSYFTAYLLLNTINGGKPAPFNPGNPYIGSKTQNGFATAATLAAVAAEALEAVWYQKWLGAPAPPPRVRRRDRVSDKNGPGRNCPGPGERHGPELAGGAGRLHREQQLFSIAGLPGSFADTSGLSDRAWRGGRRLHHRLENFFDGSFPIETPIMPSRNGTATAAYTAPPGEPPLTVNGELHKLVNISFGHGIHAGIH